MTKQEAMQVQDAMDNLAVALVSHAHKWSREERREYEKAQRVLCRETARPKCASVRPANAAPHGRDERSVP